MHITFLILFPLAAAVLILMIRDARLRSGMIRASAAIIALASIITAVMFFKADVTVFTLTSDFVYYLMLVVDAFLAVYIIAVSIKNRKYIAILLVLISTPALLAFEVFKGHSLEAERTFSIDRLSLIMICMIGVIGSLITIYGIGYMKEYHSRHKEHKDKSAIFFAIVFIFLSAMFGLVLSNNLIFMLFFWEITTVCSFLLIGYTRAKEAIDNAFRALKVNLFGGLCFTAAVIYIGYIYNTVEIDNLITLGTTVAMLPIALLALAGMTKSAQMPFSGWLIGAMVAPTPVSALLHSATMVKAGIYILLRLSPLLGDNLSGVFVTMIGGMTFLAASFIAISQSDAKKVLAYSTVANLGLVVACAGIGTYEALWAGILLIIFHAVSKSQMFICVGTAEHQLGSRDIEDMDGLVIRMPRLALMMVIGIAGMFLAPFGMLISKWAAMKAFIDSGNILILLFLVFGSSATMLYWTKWLGKLMTIKRVEKLDENLIRKDEWLAITTQAVLTILLCIVFPLISLYMLEPYLRGVFGFSGISIITTGDIEVMLLMVGMLIMLPAGFILFKKNIHYRKSTVYMAGQNTGDNISYHGSIGKDVQISMSNFYMSGYFGEARLGKIAVILSAVFVVTMFTLIVRGGIF